MIYAKNGERLDIGGTFFSVGDRIRGIDCEYEGLTGFITLILTDEDMDTENTGPDIYCTFTTPDSPEEIKRIEEIFSDLYDEPKTVDDIVFDEVIMAPDMIERITE